MVTELIIVLKIIVSKLDINLLNLILREIERWRERLRGESVSE